MRRVNRQIGGGEYLVGVASSELCVYRRRFARRSVSGVLGGDDYTRVCVSLSRGQRVERMTGGRSTTCIAAVGDVSVNLPQTTTRYIIDGPAEIIQIAFLHGPTGAAPERNGTHPDFNVVAHRLESLAYHIAHAIWLGEAHDPLFLSGVLHRARTSLANKSMLHSGGLSLRATRLVSQMIEARLDARRAAPTLPELAAAAGLSVFHFSRAFQQSFGIPPYRFMVRRRLSRARDMLVEGHADLADISARLGFSSVPHFTSTFGREMGVTPARFRRILQEVGRQSTDRTLPDGDGQFVATFCKSASSSAAPARSL